MRLGHQPEPVLQSGVALQEGTVTCFACENESESESTACWRSRRLPRDRDRGSLHGDDHRVTVTVTVSAAGICSQEVTENLSPSFTARNKNNREHRRHLWLIRPADVRMPSTDFS